ncbi:MAG: RNA polymerase sigma factor [Deltaproteobacteria bacterium]|nr:RNA polymerase sigma factor [Deltaproteobacteria bacterium]
MKPQLVHSARDAFEPELSAVEVAVSAAPSLSSLYATHLPFVRRAVAHLAGPDLEHDDLVQDVFVQAVKSHHTFESRSSVQTWLYGIALRVVGNARRRAKFRRLLGLQAKQEPQAPSTDASQLLDRAQTRASVHRILERLPEKKRTVLVLHELEGVPGEEIAEILQCPVGTVWTRLHHARRQFQLELEKEAGRSP